MKKSIKKILESLPSTSGVYLFKNRREEILYIGKATNIKERVSSHFKNPAALLKESMLEQIIKIDYLAADNAREALILEDRLIKKYQPKFNVQRKDDKSYFWVTITNERYPQVTVTHRHSRLHSQASRLVNERANLKSHISIGPFVNGKELRSFLRQIRKIAPFRTCRFLPKKPCLQYDLGTCPGWCLSKTAYRSRNDRNPENTISLIVALLKIYQEQSGRLEAYDISNLQGKSATGSMVVLKNNKPQKSQYRLFKIKTVFQADDPKMQAEIVSRRFGHSEWPRPDLILLDGGKGQVSVVNRILGKTGIPCLGLAKKEERLYSPFSKNSVKLNSLPRAVADALMRARDEAHRFAITYHRKLRTLATRV